MGFSLRSIETVCDYMVGKRLYSETDDIPPHVDGKELAGLAVPEQLGAEDIFYLLAHQESIDMPDRSKAAERLRRVIDLPPFDPYGIKTGFITAPLDSGGQLAILKITPTERVDKLKNPLIFFGGLYHKQSMYYAFLTQIAREEGREIYAVDSPGVGASQLPKGFWNGRRVRAQFFSEVLIKTVKAAGLSGKPVDIMGHSLGSIPVRNALFNRENLERQDVYVDKYVMIAPVPAEREKSMGYDIAGRWVFGTVGSLFVHQLEVFPTANDLFFNNHTDEEKRWAIAQVAKESYPADIVTFFDLFDMVDENPIMDELASGNGRLSVAFGGNDRLMKLDAEGWREKEGIHIVDGADHSFICWSSQEGRVEDIVARNNYVRAVRAALNSRGRNSADRINSAELYNHIGEKGEILAKYFYGGPYGLHGGVIVDDPLFKGIKFLVNPWAFIGTEDFSEAVARSGVDLALYYKGLDSRLSIGPRVGVHYTVNNLEPKITAGAGIEYGFNGLFAGAFVFAESGVRVEQVVPAATISFGWRK